MLQNSIAVGLTWLREGDRIGAKTSRNWGIHRVSQAPLPKEKRPPLSQTVLPDRFDARDIGTDRVVQLDLVTRSNIHGAGPTQRHETGVHFVRNAARQGALRDTAGDLTDLPSALAALVDAMPPMRGLPLLAALAGGAARHVALPYWPPQWLWLDVAPA